MNYNYLKTLIKFIMKLDILQEEVVSFFKIVNRLKNNSDVSNKVLKVCIENI